MIICTYLFYSRYRILTRIIYVQCIFKYTLDSSCSSVNCLERLSLVLSYVDLIRLHTIYDSLNESFTLYHSKKVKREL